MNQITLCGNLVREFQTGYTQKTGTLYVRSVLAVNEYRKDEKGEYIQSANFIPIVLYGKRAELANKWLKKGDKFLGTGKIVTYTYTSGDGQTNYGWQALINSFDFVHNLNKDTQNNVKVAKQEKPINQPINDKDLEDFINSEKEIPF